MGLFSGVTNLVKDTVDLGFDIFTAPYDAFYDVAGDVYQGVKGTVEGALRGDPIAIASLAAMAYGAYSIYSAYAAATTSATAATTTSTTTATSASATGTGAAAQQGVNQEFMKQVAANLAETGGTQAGVQSAAQAAGQKVVEEQVKKMTLTGVLKTVGSTVLPAVASAALAPTPSIPTIERRASPELFDLTPNVQIGAGNAPDTVGGISQGSSNQAQNLTTLGRLSTNEKLTNLRI